VGDQLIVAFGDTENFVDGLNPGERNGFFVDNGSKNGAEGFTETQDSKENRVHSLRLRREKRPQASGSFLGNQVGID
jgi:hypothetical protein